MRTNKSKKMPPLSILRRIFSYDPDTGIFRWNRDESRLKRWNNSWAGKIAGGRDNYGYTYLLIGGRQWKAHRVAWALVHGEMPTDLVIDHINGNPSDNRIANLRACKRIDNQANMRRHRDATWPKGVSKIEGRFCARICRGGRRLHIPGGFDTPEEAHAEYLRVAEQTFGEFARAD